MYNNELYHFGIKGMKWGVRRYQRTDGSLTAAGKRRYSDAEVLKANKKINTRKDSFVLEKGTTIHRSTYNADESGKEGHAFASFKGKDAKGYASRNKLFSGGKKHSI